MTELSVDVVVAGTKAGTGLVKTATGDGLVMAWSAGAAERGADVAQRFGLRAVRRPYVYHCRFSVPHREGFCTVRWFFIAIILNLFFLSFMLCKIRIDFGTQFNSDFFKNIQQCFV
ncbi:hypothetical protein [Treponema sp. Marseille-Q4130]|uniref:hypothetical protein n=1 Tax=Treponema sp. Marseille-Q4130 TaxID=2766702 RepID=UPI001652AEE2|nr:hypothetical protein [Treponema sp. Marseille-Q4130]MBC6719507.1 hypothetical protein [Treponema sp. Marseille-Q4130]